MSTSEHKILNRLYLVAVTFFLFAVMVVYKVVEIQFFNGAAYREKAEKSLIKNVKIPANRGNIYAFDGSLLATSIPKYDISIDAIQASELRFETHITALCDSLEKFTGKSSSVYERKIRTARKNKKRYCRLVDNLSYSEYLRVRDFPLLSYGAIKGGLIIKQHVEREYPMGGIAARSIGYERYNEDNTVTRAGFEGAFGETYLRGVEGEIVKQYIGKGKWKPISDTYNVDPKDGYDLHTTLDINIQDIAHHTLLKQLETYKADHGCVVVMEVETGEIKAISNLAKTRSGKYYEKRNYAVWESSEPGSTFKVMSLMAALEDKAVDTATIVDTKNGAKKFYGRIIRDAHYGGFGKISVARALEVSSNIGLATIIDDYYKKTPEKLIQHFKNWNLADSLNIPILGEGKPLIPGPNHRRWSKNALPSISYGYNLRLTPLHILTFYNAIANNGVMVKPRFVKAVKSLDQNIKVFEKEIINKKLCSDETLKQIQKILEHVVSRGTAKNLYTQNFLMAGKTGTTQLEYWMKDWEENKRYASSFVGYFPAEAPKYSCIVVINKPNTNLGIYGADVSGPVFKTIAQKIFIDTPLINEVKLPVTESYQAESGFDKYKELEKKYRTIMPKVVGLPSMDALTLLENLDVDVNIKLKGHGIIKDQSVRSGIKLQPKQTIILEAI